MRAVSLIVLGFLGLIFIPFYNDLWRELTTLFISVFGITGATPSETFFLLWTWIMPYAVAILFVIAGFKILRGNSSGRNEGDE